LFRMRPLLRITCGGKERPEERSGGTNLVPEDVIGDS